MSDPGEIWIANVPFVQGQGSKKRPVLILWADGVDRIVATVTTASARTVSDVPMQDWEHAGLVKPSVVRLMRPTAILGARLIKKVGVISRRDADTLNATWAEHLQLKL